VSRLSTEQLARMSRLLDEVVDADEAARRRWLDNLAPEHRDLQPALGLALFAQEPPDRVLDTLPQVGEAAPMLQAGAQVGPYRLVRPLGSGGMAEVWLAQRADGAFRREVALKTPARLDARDDLVRRFAIERDILAALEHPRIARFYDAGVSDDGRPYLALEYVPGRHLLQWADERRAGIRERIELFLQLLDAVQYAHDKGVLHRDIKPGNVLVTDAGQVHLLDFGVSRSIRRRADAEVTQGHGLALTPAYASPEQLKGAGLEAPSDVYSLGVVLYELLSGRQPHEPTARMTDVEPPSVRIDDAAADVRGSTKARLRRALQGDLDAIVLKAMSASPSQRYDSAAALGSDLRRHLAREPVHARPHALTYRAGKFMARHRLGMSAGAFVSIVVAGMAYTIVQTQLDQEPASVAAVAPPASPALRRFEVQDLLLQGDVYANGPFERDAERAEIVFRKAAALATDDAMPWAKLAHLHLSRATWSPAARDERHARAREAVETALQIDAESMAARAARFRYAVQVDHRWADARAELDRMRMIDPKEAQWLPACEAHMAGVVGKLDEAISIQQRLVHRNPASTPAVSALAWYLFHADRFEEASALWHHELQLNPHAVGAHGLVGVSLALLGKGELGLAAIAKETNPVTRLWALSIAQWTMGRREASHAALDELRRYPKGNAYAIAQLYAVQGRRTLALEWLSRACLERQGGCDMLRADRFFRGLRNDPRHRTLLAKMKLDRDPLLD
jgi:serine/threonine protein kinase/tetratricopeptide (TPR) repeat protein